MHASCNNLYGATCEQSHRGRSAMTALPGVDRDAGVRALSEQLPRLMRLIHGLKAQAAADGGRDRAAHVLLFPLCRLGPLRQSALADLVHADPSTVSRHVTQLVEK